MSPRRKTLPIRTWLALSLLAVIVVPLLTTWVAMKVASQWSLNAARERLVREVALEADHWDDPAWQSQVQSSLAEVRLDAVLRDGLNREILRTAPDPIRGGWTSAARLTGDGPLSLKVDLLPRNASPSDRALLVGRRPAPLPDGNETVSGPYDQPLTMWVRQVVDAHGRLPTAFFWGPVDTSLFEVAEVLVPSSLFAGLLLAIGGVAWFIGRAILRPLAAMSQAARQIADGDLDIEVPPSQAREVAEVGTAFHAMGEALRGSLYRQAEMEQDRRLLISAVAHDLRTPLFSLRGYLEGLGKGLANSPEKRDRYVAICQEKATELERLISDLFDYTRVEYLEQAPRRESLELGALLRRVVEGVRPQAEAKGVTLLTLGPSEPCSLTGDHYLLTRAVENLLDNALRHTPRGGRVVVNWGAGGDRLTFAVADDGPGFDPSDLPHVFTPLYRAETSRNRRTGGAGLGLTIAQRILRAHAGDLTAANAPAGGAVLTGTLPHATEAEASPDAPVAAEARTACGEARLPGGLSGPRPGIGQGERGWDGERVDAG